MGLLQAASRYQVAPQTGIEITDEYRDVFVVEAREHLDEWETALLELENRPDDEGLINQIFRAIHTLKGSAGFIGYGELQRLSHDLESTLQRVRDGEQPLTEARTEVLFEGLDMSKRMLESFADRRECSEDVDGFLRSLADSEALDLGQSSQTGLTEITDGVEAGTRPSAEPLSASSDSGEPAAAAAGSRSRRVTIKVFVDSTGREAFLRAYLLRSRIASVASIVNEEPNLEILKDSVDRFDYLLTVVTTREEAEIRAAANIDQIEVRWIREEDSAEQSITEQRESSDNSCVDGREASKNEKQVHHDEVVRVSVERLDNLLNLVGELVVQNSNFVSLSEEMAADFGRGNVVVKMQERTENLAKITRDLQDGIMKVRMLPVNTVFMRFHRVVRDLARSSNKEVSLEIFGGETEIDKKVIDRIGDPLVHLIRNAVDHGIETTAQRQAAGKPPAGTVRLGAFQDGDHICIEISDDGSGLDRESILKKGRAKGLVKETDEALTEEQVLGLIFRPGFSTAERVTDVSGRGVGMDVVKQTIETLGGSVRVRSAFGKGTTVTITLPLTMAIIRAILVDVEGLTVAIPLSAVKEVLKVTADEMKSVGLRQVVRLREEVLAIVHMVEVLGMESDGDAEGRGRKSPVIVVDYEGRKIGLRVSRVLGTQEIVIKSLSRHYKEVDGFIGATILGDGKIALIVDVEAIVRRFHRGANHDKRTPANSTVLPAPTNRRLDEQRHDRVGDVEHGKEVHDAQASAETPATEDEPAALSALYERAAEVLVEVGSSGALRASMTLSQLTGIDVRAGFPESELVELSAIGEILGGEESEMTGIYVGITGAIVGGILISVPVDRLPAISAYLHGGVGGAGNTQEDVDMSAIAEFGNMLSASFINAIGDETHLLTQLEPPEISVDLCLAVVDSVIARFNTAGDHLLLTRAEVMFGEEENITCSLLLFLEPKSLERLLTAFATVGV